MSHHVLLLYLVLVLAHMYLQQLVQSHENDTKYHEETIVPFTEKLGNTKIELLPGDNKIYIYKPKELGDIIKNFVSKELKQFK